MSRTTYDADAMTITVDDDGVQEGLGEFAAKTPAVLKVAINTTARQMRKEEISEAEKRYALTSKGKARLKDFKQTRKASNSSLVNIHKQSDRGRKFDMAYFQHTPDEVHTGWDAVMNSPEHYRVRILKSESFQNIVGKTNKSKGFLATFTNQNAGNEHIGMVNRKLDKYTQHYRTKSGKRRWRASGGSKKGVEALETTARPGASSMQRKVWDETVEKNTEENLQANVEKRMEQVIAKAAAKK